jgi:hypothetical protein
MGEKPEAENAGAVWMLATIALCLCVIVGCQPVRRPRVQQKISGWQCELINNIHVTTTNGMIIFEMGGAK